MFYRAALATVGLTLAAATAAEAQQVSINSSNVCSTYRNERLCMEVFGNLGILPFRVLTDREWIDGLKRNFPPDKPPVTPTDPGLGPVTVSPEPASLLLLATGLLGVGGALRSRRRQQV